MSEILNETVSKENETQMDDVNNTTSPDNDNNTTIVYNTNTPSENEVELESGDEKGNNKKVPARNIGLKKHITGSSSVLLILAILIVAYIAISKYKKD